jgi:hypothetical protein
MRQWLLQSRCDERNMADKTAKDKSRADANRKDISYGDVDFRWSAEDILAHFKVDMNKVRRSIDRFGFLGDPDTAKDSIRPRQCSPEH